MVRQCCKCKKLDFLNPGLSFHKFPRDQTNRQIWLAILCLENRTVPKTADVCSDHFDKQDMTYNSRGSCILKNNVFPKYKLIETQIQRESLQEQFFEPTIKTEVTEKSSDNQHMNDIKIFANWLIKSEETPTKEENKIKEKNSFDISLANYIDIQVKVETTETGDEVDKFNECLFDDNTIKNEEVFVKEELLEAEENSSQSHYVGKRKTEDEEFDQSQSPSRLFNKDKCAVFRCSECNYETFLKSHLTRHLRRHNPSVERLMYQCDQCDYQSIRESYFRNHLLRHKNTERVDMHKCYKCDYQTFFRGNLKVHLRCHDDRDKEYRYKCNQCAYETFYQNCLKRHLRHYPHHKDIYRCDECHYRTTNKRYLIIHLSCHRNKDLKMFKCNSCDYQTRYKNNLIPHFRVHQNSDRVYKYKCNHCDYQTLWKQSLKEHIFRFHLGSEDIETFKCYHCDYQTLFKYRIGRHVLCHTNK